MAKVLFVICVPVEENTKFQKLNGDKEKDNEDKSQGTDKIKDTDDEADAELKGQKENKDAKSFNFPKDLLTEVSEAGMKEPSESGSDVSENNLQTGNHVDKNKVSGVTQESSKRMNFVEASEKKVEKTDAESALLSSANVNKFPLIKKTDASDISTNNNKEKESASEQKPEVDNRNKIGKNGDKNADETDGIEKKDSPKNNKRVVDFGEDHETEYISFVSDGLTLLERVKATLDVLDIQAINWNLTQDNIYTGMFIAGSGEHCEEILNKLTYLDIGNVPGSSISVFPASISVASLAKEEQDETLKMEMDKEKIAAKVSEFKKSIKSRLVVAQVVDSVKSDAVFSFDYLMLLILAGLVAIMGLLEASSVTLVASMLISPLMGPIIAFVFGAIIRNTELTKVGIASETKGLALCILVGFLSGLIPAGLESAGLAWRSTDSWPTVEMSARGSLRALPVGVLIALPSGAGVALSILGGKVGSLVGVAISASLLPPAVNAGLLWANAIIVSFAPPLTVRSSKIASQNSSEISAGTLYEPDLDCPMLLNNDYIPTYSCNMAVESVILGVISLLLTLVNIICIIIMGIVVLKIKEVAPMRSVPDAEKDFFAKDLKVARESYETTKGPNSSILGKRIFEEYQKFKEEIGVDDTKNTDSELNEILEDVEEADDVQEILDKLPHRPKRWSSYVESKEDEPGTQYHTFHGASTRPSSPDIGITIRKRGSAVVSFSPPRIDDDRHSSVYHTTHRFHPTTDVHHSPRISHRSPGRYFSKKFKGRFHVAKVEEDNHILPKAPSASSSPPKVDIMPAIKEQESVPLLNISPKVV